MIRFKFEPVLKVVVVSMVSTSLLGCSGTFEQEAQTVRVSPISKEYKLDQKLEGNTYILLAETSTGQEQHRYAVSDSLARALKTGGKCEPNVENGVFIPFVGDYKLQVAGICDEGHKVLSFTDFSNKLNEKGLCRHYAEMKRFYQENGLFRKSDLDILANEIGADYLILPCLLDVRRWSTGRLSVVGVKFLNTQIVSGILGLEIWDTKAGRKVFSATSDVTIASEKIKEEPISMEDAFERAWLGIMSQLPAQLPTAPAVHVADSESKSSGMNEQEDKDAVTNDKKKETKGESAESFVGMISPPAKGL